MVGAKSILVDTQVGEVTLTIKKNNGWKKYYYYSNESY